MKVVNIGNIADAFRFDDLPATGIVIEATPDELGRLPSLAYKEVTISATPRRNCDVGTPEEQNRRFLKFCDIYDCGSNCPLFKADSCELAWAQMPYNEGADK